MSMSFWVFPCIINLFVQNLIFVEKNVDTQIMFINPRQYR